MGGDRLRKVTGIKNLISYLESVQYPISDEKINELIKNNAIPHLRRLNTLFIFNLDHIDSWIIEQRSKR